PVGCRHHDDRLGTRDGGSGVCLDPQAPSGRGVREGMVATISALTAMIVLSASWAFSTHVGKDILRVASVSGHTRIRASRGGGSVLARLGRSSMARRITWSEPVHRRWVAAGRPGSVQEWQGRRLAGAVVGGVGVVILTSLAPAAVVLMPVALVAGFRIP